MPSYSQVFLPPKTKNMKLFPLYNRENGNKFIIVCMNKLSTVFFVNFELNIKIKSMFLDQQITLMTYHAH